jgi:hypothetical protein
MTTMMEMTRTTPGQQMEEETDGGRNGSWLQHNTRWKQQPREDDDNVDDGQGDNDTV